MTDELWSYIEDRLFYGKTGMFYDVVLDDLAPIPSLSDIANDLPNKNGCGTKTEDAMISGGTALEGLLLRIKRSGEGKIFAQNTVNGLLDSAESGKDGFLPRSIQPIDGISHYRDTSRDQITMLFYGLTLYYFSDVCDEKTAERIKSVISNATKRAKRNVTAENGYNLLTEDGEYSENCVMWGDTLKPHEVGRLPFMYLCDYAVNGNVESFTRYKSLRDEALKRSLPLGTHCHFYTLQQMTATLDIARKFDKEYSEKYQSLLIKVAEYAVSERERISMEIKSIPDVHFYDRTDWRSFYAVQNPAILGIIEHTAYGKISEETKALIYEVAKKLISDKQRSALPIHYAVALEMINESTVNR